MMRLQMAGPQPNLGFGRVDQLQRSAGRRRWGSTVLMVAASLAIAVVSYSLSIKVSGERAEVDRIARENVALVEDLKSLEAELRVRMRLPELQRWNDDVLGLMPIKAQQYLDNPVQLAAYGTAPDPKASAAPSLELAIAPQRPANVVPRTVSHTPSSPATAKPRPSFTPSAPTYSQQPSQKPEGATTPPAALRTVALETPPAPRPEARPAEKPRTPATPAARSDGLDPLLIAAINEAARREASTPRSAPADLLMQVDLADARLSPTH